MLATTVCSSAGNQNHTGCNYHFQSPIMEANQTDVIRQPPTDFKDLKVSTGVGEDRLGSVHTVWSAEVLYRHNHCFIFSIIVLAGDQQANQADIQLGPWRCSPIRSWVGWRRKEGVWRQPWGRVCWRGPDRLWLLGVGLWGLEAEGWQVHTFDSIAILLNWGGVRQLTIVIGKVI